MTVHALAGLPRSGSTLLANILSQHPDVHVSGTSVLAPCIGAVTDRLSVLPEVQSDLANVPGAYENYLSALRGFVEGWYASRDEPVIIDKGRGWMANPLLLRQIDPDSRIICCVRDPRDVIASIERQHRKTPLFDSPLGHDIVAATEAAMSRDGMVGAPLFFMEDAIRRGTQFLPVRYESLVLQPELVLDRITEHLKLPAHKYDFDNVEDLATDLDAIYRGKFPHRAAGQVQQPSSHWSDVLPEGLAEAIANAYPLFMQTFGYQEL